MQTDSNAVWPELTWSELEAQLLAHAWSPSHRFAISHLTRSTRECFLELAPSQRFAELLAVFATVLIPAEGTPPTTPSHGPISGIGRGWKGQDDVGDRLQTAVLVAFAALIGVAGALFLAHGVIELLQTFHHRSGLSG